MCAAHLVFREAPRRTPSLRRGWRTPDPSPTRASQGLPGCGGAGEWVEEPEDQAASAAAPAEQVQEEDRPVDAGEYWETETVWAAEALAEDDVPLVPSMAAYFGRRPARDAAPARGAPARTLLPVGFELKPQRVRTVSWDMSSHGMLPTGALTKQDYGQDCGQSPCRATDPHQPMLAAMPRGAAASGPQRVPSKGGSSTQPCLGDPIYVPQIAPCPMPNVTVMQHMPYVPSEPPIPPPPDHAPGSMPEEAQTAPRPVPCPVSIGSVGHPFSCAGACKYARKRRGCKDGVSCDRCHLCEWKRHGPNAGEMKKER